MQLSKHNHHKTTVLILQDNLELKVCCYQNYKNKTPKTILFMFNNIVVCNITNKSRLFILVVQLTENSGYKLSQTSYKLTHLQAYLHSKTLFHPSLVIILPSHTPDINTSTPTFLLSARYSLSLL